MTSHDLYRPIKLDGRHSGHEKWGYYIEPLIYSSGARYKMFHEWRKWCWNTYGESMERDHAAQEQLRDYKWCWFVYNGIYRIYLKSDKELNWFKIRWPIAEEQ